MVYIPTDPVDAPGTSTPEDITEELFVQRVNTSHFIAADPHWITLRTRTSSRTASGAVVRSGAAVARPEQRFKLIMVSPAGGSLEQRTEDGTERQVEYQLLGEWDAVVEVGDYWDDSEDQRWEVRAIVPDNGYERRAVVEAHGRELTGG